MQVPAIVTKAPTIPLCDMFWMNAYTDLSAERETEWVVTKAGIVPTRGRIRPVAILDYADRFGIPAHQLRYLIDELDKIRP